MELRQYLRILRAWWWLAAIPFIAVVGLTGLLTEDGPPMYRSTANLLVQPRTSTDDEGLRATDYLLRTDQVAPTLGEIATGAEVEQRARAALGGTSEAERDLVDQVEVSSQVLAGTTIVTLHATGPTPELAREYLHQVTTEAIDYLASLDHLFTLAPLDEPSLASSPVASKRPVALAGAVVLGMMLAGLAVFLAEYLRKPAGRVHAFDVLDPSTGLNNEAFFNVRFDQELSRCRRNGGRFTVVMVHVERSTGAGEHAPAHPRDVQLVAELLAIASRPEDVLAHVGDGAIMALLPDTSQAQAEQITTQWRRQLWPATDGTPPPSSPFAIRIGLCQYGQTLLHGEAAPQQLANRN